MKRSPKCPQCRVGLSVLTYEQTALFGDERPESRSEVVCAKCGFIAVIDTERPPTWVQWSRWKKKARRSNFRGRSAM